MLLPTTTARVPEHTPDRYNEAIRRQTEENVARCANAGREAIARRLAVIDQEWDIERALEANAASIALLGLGLGAFVDRRFFALPALIAGFLLQHSLQGWCPPVPLLRRLGIRTAAEIEQERYALKALRGDFYDVHEATEGPSDGKFVSQALEAVRR
jgi:hypothetical protein